MFTRITRITSRLRSSSVSFWYWSFVFSIVMTCHVSCISHVSCHVVSSIFFKTTIFNNFGRRGRSTNVLCVLYSASKNALQCKKCLYSFNFFPWRESPDWQLFMSSSVSNREGSIFVFVFGHSMIKSVEMTHGAPLRRSQRDTVLEIIHIALGYIITTLF